MSTIGRKRRPHRDPLKPNPFLLNRWAVAPMGAIQWVRAKMRLTFSSEKNSAGDTTPVTMLMNPSIAGWLPATAPRTCWSSGGGGSSVAS